MSDTSTPPRPRQATVAASLIMAGSVFVVLTVFERVSSLRSIETREAVQKFLAEPPGQGLGLGVEEVLDVMRVLAMVAGACAAAAAILGYHALKRSRSSRLALAVLAGPLFLTGLVAGGFMSSVVVAASVMLWLQPSRDWFNGVTRPSPERTAPVVPEAAPPVSPSVSEPRAHEGFGAVPQQAHEQSQTGGSTAVGQTPDSPTADAPTARPAALTGACVLTWVCSGLAVTGMLLSVLALLASPDVLFDELRRQDPDLAGQGLSEDMIAAATYVTAAVLVTWSIAAIVLAALAFRGVGWARVALVVSAVTSALFCLIGLIVSMGSLLLVLPLVASAATVVLLLRSDVRAWYASRGSIRS